MASGLHPSSRTHTNTLIFSRHISADALSTQMTAVDSSLKADGDLRLWVAREMTFSPCGGPMQEFFIGAFTSGRCTEPDNELLASSLGFCVFHYCRYQAKRHFVFCANDFVTGTILSCPQTPGPALMVQCDARHRSNLSLIADKLILRWQKAEFTAE